jgi:uncharacterized protein with ParB-like and HNH nuclease domain
MPLNGSLPSTPPLKRLSSSPNAKSEVIPVKAIDRSFTTILNNASQFVIPVFQRDYTWHAEPQCAQLWRDVLRAARVGADHGHFLGAIVYVATSDISPAFARWLLIDGQQRLTTLLLLLAALRDHIRDTGWSRGDDDPTPEKIDAYFLKNVHETGEREQKLVLRRHDQATPRGNTDAGLAWVKALAVSL